MGVLEGKKIIRTWERLSSRDSEYSRLESRSHNLAYKLTEKQSKILLNK